MESKFTERISPCCSENLSLLLNLSFNKFFKSLSNSIACNFLISESNNLDVKAPLPGPISKIKSFLLRSAISLIFSNFF